MSLPYVITDAAGTRAFLLNPTFHIADHSSAFGWGMQQLPRMHGGRATDEPYLGSRAIVLRGVVSAGSHGGALPTEALTPFSYTAPGNAGDIKFQASDKSINAANANFSRLQIGQQLTISLASQAGNNKMVTLATVSPKKLTTVESLVNEDSSHAQLTASMLPTSEVVYLSQLHNMAAFFYGNKRGILDYRNGYIQYVLFDNLRFTQGEGWPADRTVDINLLCDDPFGYALALLTGSFAFLDALLLVQVGGNAPSNNYRLQLRSNTAQEQVVDLFHVEGNTTMRLTLPANTADPIVLHGWQRLLYQTSLSNRVWSRMAAGGVFPTLQPNQTNTFVVYVDGQPQVMTDMSGANGSATVQAQLTAHSAIWLADSFQAPANLPAGQYDISQYDVAVYG